ncbi:hypothetical protein H4Q32_012739 [Labeo rohita]|uniref:ribonuclease H n=1 Tax=Labeo rohita TaxID=84645 RepID=A0ABQ8LZ72_LABRO|nr:hypothetical protein H4Q32_012739 [Labeo rohita]
MPRVEQTLVSYLCPGVGSSLKAPTLLTKPLHTTLSLVGKGYSSAVQAGACLHTMAVLQGYQADLLKELDKSDEIKAEDITELHRATDLSLRATKETTHAIGRVILLDLLAPSGLFGDSVNAVVDRFQEAWRRSRGIFLAALQLLRLLGCGPFFMQRWLRLRSPDVRGSGLLRADSSGEEWLTPHHTVPISPQCPQKIAHLSASARYHSGAGRFATSEEVFRTARSVVPRGEAYQYRVLPFGLGLSPCTFTKCMDAALAPLRLQGIRILNYIDDWLILAQTEQMAVQHRDVVLAHMKELGLRLNAKKSVLSPLQMTTYLGVVWDSTTMQARLSPARIESILTSVKRVKIGRSLTVKQFQKLLGLMAAVSNVIPFGLLYMRPLQWWLRTKGFSPRGNPLRMIKVTRQCFCALDMWRKPWFLNQGPVSGAPCRRVTLATDASLTNLRDHHVLVRTNNTSVVSYINHQGGLHSRPLYKLAQQILGADILSRQEPRPGEWRLHPEVVELIWRVFGQAQVDLFVTQETSQCHLWFYLSHQGSLGLDAMVQTWPRLRLYAFPLITLLPGVLERVRQDGISLLLVAPFWPGRVWFSDLIALLDGSPWEIPVRRNVLSQAGGTILHPRPELWKLAPGWSSLNEETVCLEVETLLFLVWRPPARPSPLPSWYSAGVLAGPVRCRVDPLHLVGVRGGHSFFPLPSWWSISGKTPLGYTFPPRCAEAEAPVRSHVPTWDLAVVLEALCRPPFEPLEEVSDRMLTLKMVFLLAISSLKRVGDLQALSVAPSHLDFAPGMAKAFLYPSPGYVPKLPASVPRPIVLQAFCPPPFQDQEQQRQQSDIQSTPGSSVLSS